MRCWLVVGLFAASPLAAQLVQANAGTGSLAYTAICVTDGDVLNATGSTKHIHIEMPVARDASGRVRYEEQAPTSTAEKPVTQIVIEDPLAKAVYVIDPSTKTVIRERTAGPSSGGTFPTHLPPVPIDANIRSVKSARTALGDRQFSGLAAQGSRQTLTLDYAPDLPEEQATDDTWQAVDSHVVLEVDVNDPRIGNVSLKLTDLKLGPPPAELFEVPKDYAVTDEGGSAADAGTARPMSNPIQH